MSLLPAIGHLLLQGVAALRHRPPSQVPALDALRSAAILGVIGSHYSVNTIRTLEGALLPAPDILLFRFGWAGVDLFFVLSGFLIGKQIWREMRDTGELQVGRFLLRRGLRIWPLYYLVLLLQHVLLPQFPVGWSDVAFLSNYVPGGLGGGWSLSVEEQFYLAVPLLLVLTHRWVPLRRYVWLLAAVVLAVPVLRVLHVRSLLASGLPPETIAQILHQPFQFHLHCEALALGLVLSLATVVKRAWFRRRADAGFSWPAAAVLLGALVTGVGLRALDREVFTLTGIAIIFAGATCFVLLDRSWVTRVLGGWFFYLVSRLSYGMYLNHFPSLHLTVPRSRALLATVTSNEALTQTVDLVASVLVSMLLATVTFVLVEHPFLALRERWLERRASVGRAERALAA